MTKKKMEDKLKERQFRLMNFITGESEKLIDTEYYVEGYAATFEPYVLFESDQEKIYEQFDRTCFDGADMSDVIFLYNHEGKVLARQSNNTLITRIDDKGLFVAVDLSKSEASRQMYDEIKSGLVTKMSWSFRVGEHNYDEKTKTIHHKSVRKVFDVSAVSIPANNGTEINARSFVDGVILQERAERLECEKLALQIRLELIKGEFK